MNDKTFDIGVIGCGSIATERHIPTYDANDRANVRAVYDHKIDNVNSTARKFDIPEAYNSLDQFLDSPLDLVSICTPPFTHAELTVQTLEAGIDVLCEKPMAMNVTEAEEMIAAAESNDRSLGIVHNFLFSRSLQKVKQLQRTGELGDIRIVKGFQVSSPRRDLPSWYPQLPGGLFFDESPHLLYLMEHFMGDLELTNMTTRTDPVVGQSFQSVNATFSGEGDCIGQLTMVFDAPLSEWFLIVVGSNRVVVVDIFRDILLQFGREESHSALEVLGVSLNALYQGSKGILTSGIELSRGNLFFGLEVIVDQYLDHLEGKENKLLVDGEDGVEILRTMVEVIEASDVEPGIEFEGAETGGGT